MKTRQPDQIRTAFRSGQGIDQAIAQAALSAKVTETGLPAKRSKRTRVAQPAHAKR